MSIRQRDRQHMEIRVPGLPKAQPRVKAFRRGQHVGMYTPKSADDWKDAVNHAVQRVRQECEWETLPLRTPIAVMVDYHFPRASGFRKAARWKSTKPDIDNCNKAVFECLVWCGIMADDGQIVDSHTRKLIDDDWQGAVITVTSLPEGGEDGFNRRTASTAQCSLAGV